MRTLIRSMSLRRFIFEQAPIIGGALFIAEVFYKFHSFTLECIAFLATWYVLDGMMAFLYNLLGKPPKVYDPSIQTKRKGAK